MQPYGQQQSPVVQHPLSSVPTGMSQALGISTTRSLGIGHCVCGTVLFLLQIVALALVSEHDFYSSVHYGGTGIWCGIFVILCGVLGICAAKYKSHGLVIAFLIFSVLCGFIFNPVMFGVLGADLSEREWHFRDNVWNSDTQEYVDKNSAYGLMVAITAIMLMASLISFVLSIWGLVTSSIAIKKARSCCSCCCACCEKTPAQAPVIIYVPASQMPGQVAPAPAGAQIYAFPNGPAGTQSTPTAPVQPLPQMPPVQLQQGFIAPQPQHPVVASGFSDAPFAVDNDKANPPAYY